MTWLGESVPKAPAYLKAAYRNKQVQLTWHYSKRPNNVYGYVIYRFNKGEKVDINKPQNIIKISFNKTLQSHIDTTVLTGCKYVITAIDRFKNEGYPSKAASISNKKTPCSHLKTSL
jgi:hypothetical protein